MMRKAMTAEIMPECIISTCPAMTHSHFHSRLRLTYDGHHEPALESIPGVGDRVAIRLLRI